MRNAFELAEEPAGYLVPRIRKGLPASSLEEVARRLGMSQGLLAEKLRIAKRTLTRKASGRKPLSAEESEKVLRAARIRNLARELFISDEAVSEWLVTPAGPLGNAAPIDLLDTEVGARDVEGLIRGILYGNFQ